MIALICSTSRHNKLIDPSWAPSREKIVMCNNVVPHKLPKAMKSNVRCRHYKLSCQPAMLVILFTCFPVTYTDTNIVHCFQVSYIAERKPYSLLLLHNVFVQSHRFVIASDKYKVCLFFFSFVLHLLLSPQQNIQVIIATPLVGNTKS